MFHVNSVFKNMWSCWLESFSTSSSSLVLTIQRRRSMCIFLCKTLFWVAREWLSARRRRKKKEFWRSKKRKKLHRLQQRRAATREQENESIVCVCAYALHIGCYVFVLLLQFIILIKIYINDVYTTYIVVRIERQRERDNGDDGFCAVCCFLWTFV